MPMEFQRIVMGRAALAEIEQMQQFEFTATTPTTAGLRNGQFNSLNSLNLLTPVSPDDLVIRQRGPRSPIKVDGMRNLNAGSPLRTPTKNNAISALRSSPRKRFLKMDINGPCESQSPDKRHKSLLTPMKRIKIEEKSINRNSSLPLPSLLKGYSNEQLINIIQDLCSSHPTLETRIRENLDIPDIKVMEDKLVSLKKCINKSLPTSRLVSKTDSPAYARALPHLSNFKRTITEQSKLLADATHWDALLDYVMAAWGIVKAIPVFDSQPHNAVRRHCFKVLSQHAINSLKMGAIDLGVPRITDFSKKMKSMTADCEEIKGGFQELDYIVSHI